MKKIGVKRKMECVKEYLEKNNEIFLKVEIEVPLEYKAFLEYLALNFDLKLKCYLEFIIKREIESRNRDLHFF